MNAQRWKRQERTSMLVEVRQGPVRTRATSSRVA